jgi:hypothetical protein
MEKGLLLRIFTKTIGGDNLTDSWRQGDASPQPQPHMSKKNMHSVTVFEDDILPFFR